MTYRSLRAAWPALTHGPLSAALLVCLGLLLLAFFQRMAQEAVDHGERRRQANAQMLEATWRCRSLPDRAARGACLRLIPSVPRDNASLAF